MVTDPLSYVMGHPPLVPSTLSDSQVFPHRRGPGPPRATGPSASSATSAPSTSSASSASTRWTSCSSTTPSPPTCGCASPRPGVRAETAPCSPRLGGPRPGAARLASGGWTPGCLTPASSKHAGWRARPQDPGGRNNRLLGCKGLCFVVCPEPKHGTRLECWLCAGLQPPGGLRLLKECALGCPCY